LFSTLDHLRKHRAPLSVVGQRAVTDNLPDGKLSGELA
jgi:hypothetical protein